MTQRDPLAPLPAERLRLACDPGSLGFATTEELDGLNEAIGQERALEALEFAVGMRRDGYNLFVMGPPGIGKHTTVTRVLSDHAAAQPQPPDWCYVHNFHDPEKPIALELPPGRALTLRCDMERLVEDLGDAIPSAFQAEEYQNRVQEIEEEFKELRDEPLHELEGEADASGLRLLRTPSAFAFAPIKDGEVLSPEQFAKLPDDEQAEIQAKIVAIQERMQEMLRRMLQDNVARRERLRELNGEVALSVVGNLLATLQDRYADLPAVLEYLAAVESEIVEHFEDFAVQEQPEQQLLLGFPTQESTRSLNRFKVSVLVEHAGAPGAPVVFEDHPTYPNLIGRVEHRAMLGALTTDFTLIKPGALHRASGGYLVLDARKVLMQPLAWEGLKAVLCSGEVRIESLGEAMAIVSTVTLQPEKIPVDVKVVLMGDAFIYYSLHSLDPDFGELFKISADFEDRVDRNADVNRLYARSIAASVRESELRHFDSEAVARVIEQAARVTGDAEKISTHMGHFSDLLRESDYWAERAGHSVVTAPDVETAIAARIRRVDRMRERTQEAIVRGTVLIDTDGETVGQINGLSVLALGDFSFGQPSRITATARVGHGGVVDIEREVKLGGPSHSKGVMILSSFLAERYSKDRPLSLAASLAFEQSYGQVDGDSASVAELCALLSALSGVAIKQSFAVTGSVNQRGEVQAIGGVNEKIEGFFDVCAAQGLTGRQGVLIPASNVKHLMLRRDVVEAAKSGRFSVYTAKTVDEALTMLTGVEAGERDDAGAFPPETINGRVERRLAELFEIRKSAGAKAGEATEEKGSGDDE